MFRLLQIQSNIIVILLKDRSSYKSRGGTRYQNWPLELNLQFWELNLHALKG